MRDLVALARRLLETRKTVKDLERAAASGGALNTLDASRLLVFRGAMHALAWALEIDLDQMDAPPLTNMPEPPTRVKLHRVELEGADDGSARCLWLTEIPAHHDPLDASFSTEYWSCFFSDEHARELYHALGEALPLADAQVCTLPRQLRLAYAPPSRATPPRVPTPRPAPLRPGGQSAARASRFPTKQPDSAGGYAGGGYADTRPGAHDAHDEHGSSHGSSHGSRGA